MPKFNDLTGKVFGRWTVLRLIEHHRTKWLCRCECGLERAVYPSPLISGRSTGCARGRCNCRYINGNRTGKAGYSEHGPRVQTRKPRSPQGRRTRLPEYAAWRSMKSRCLNPNVKYFEHYGGRGITVCPPWLNSSEQFIRDMGPRPSPKHSLDRIDNDGNYEPSNCRWATKQEQRQNQRSKKKVQADLASIGGLKKST